VSSENTTLTRRSGDAGLPEELPVDAGRAATGIAIVLVAQLMLVLDATVVNVALPRIDTDLGFGPASLSLTAYWTEGYRSVAEDIGGDADDETCESGVGTGAPATYLDGETIIVCEVDDSFYLDAAGRFYYTR